MLLLRMVPASISTHAQLRAHVAFAYRCWCDDVCPKPGAALTIPFDVYVGKDPPGANNKPTPVFMMDGAEEVEKIGPLFDKLGAATKVEEKAKENADVNEAVKKEKQLLPHLALLEELRTKRFKGICSQIRIRVKIRSD